MDIRTFVTFNADFPDDAEWDENGLPLVPGGKGITLRIGELLCSQSHECLHVEQHSFYGWRFNVRVLGVLFVCLVQGYEPWLLTCEEEGSFFRRLLTKGNDEAL